MSMLRILCGQRTRKLVLSMLVAASAGATSSAQSPPDIVQVTFSIYEVGYFNERNTWLGTPFDAYEIRCLVRALNVDPSKGAFFVPSGDFVGWNSTGNPEEVEASWLVSSQPGNPYQPPAQGTYTLKLRSPANLEVVASVAIDPTRTLGWAQVTWPLDEPFEYLTPHQPNIVWAEAKNGAGSNLGQAIAAEFFDESGSRVAQSGSLPIAARSWSPSAPIGTAPSVETCVSVNVDVLNAYDTSNETTASGDSFTLR